MHALSGERNPSFNPLINHLSKDEFYKLYVEQGLTIREIYEFCGYKTPFMIQKRLREYRISRNLGRDKWSEKSKRHLSENWETEKRLKGIKKMAKTKKRLYCEEKIIPWNKGQSFFAREKNPMWKGGASFEPYGLEFNEELKDYVRMRDGYSCQKCDKTQEELGYKLHVHHIDFNKKNNNPTNLVCLCMKCHAKITANRIVLAIQK